MTQENRIKHMEREWPDGAEPEEEMKKVVDADPFAPLLRPVLDDCSYSSLKRVWTIKVVGDRTKYKSELPPFDYVSSAVHVISSLRWPGAHTLFTVRDIQAEWELDGCLYWKWIKGD